MRVIAGQQEGFVQVLQGGYAVLAMGYFDYIVFFRAIKAKGVVRAVWRGDFIYGNWGQATVKQLTKQINRGMSPVLTVLIITCPLNNLAVTFTLGITLMQLVLARTSRNYSALSYEVRDKRNSLNSSPKNRNLWRKSPASLVSAVAKKICLDPPMAIWRR